MAKRREIIDLIGGMYAQRPKPRLAHEPTCYTVVSIGKIQDHWWWGSTQRVELVSGGRKKRMTLRGNKATVQAGVANIRLIEIKEANAHRLRQRNSSSAGVQAATYESEARSFRMHFSYLFNRVLPE